MSVPAPVSPGELIAGKYRVERVLGQGGMGIVVAALHEELGERVALKFLLGDAVTDASRAGRFIREARAAARIRSEHVARVTDVGRLEDGAPYMVMEFLEGQDLEARLQQLGPLPVSEAVDYVLQACEALAEAHSLGIIHRDLKPANLFHVVRPDGMPFVKVLDFGISKMDEPAGSRAQMTQTSAMLGSPLYMSPEQLQGAKNADARADIWSLGVILYELTSKALPFDAETVAHLGAKILVEPPTPLRSVRPEISVEFEQVVNRCLSKDPSARYQTVGALAVALAPFSRDSQRSVERVTRTLHGGSRPDVAPAEASAATDRSPARRTAASWGQTSGASPKTTRKRAMLIGALSVGVVALAATIAFSVTRSSRGTSGEPTAAVTFAATNPPAAVQEPVPPSVVSAALASASTQSGLAVAPEPTQSAPSAAATPPQRSRKRSTAVPTHRPVVLPDDRK